VTNTRPRAQKRREATLKVLVPVITALITAFVTIWGIERGRAAAAPSPQELDVPPQQVVDATLPSPPETRALLTRLGVITAKLDYGEGRSSASTRAPEDADICLLTTVSSYGGASKSCSLKVEDNRWILVASGRKASVNCEATCLSFAHPAG